MAAEIHTDILHYERLNSLCRICGGRSKRQRDPNPLLCKNYVFELAKCHGIHISDETNGTLYSSTFCTKCYTRLARLKNTPCPSQRCLQSANDRIENAKRLWTPFDSTVLEVADCAVCCQFIEQSKGGRPVRIKPYFRPKKLQAQSVPARSCAISDRSISCDSFQPQTSSRPKQCGVRKGLLDYLSSGTVVNPSDVTVSVSDSNAPAFPTVEYSLHPWGRSEDRNPILGECFLYFSR